MENPDKPEVIDFDHIYDAYIASTSKRSIDDESHEKRTLRGAVCEYLDGNNLGGFLCDLYDILNREHEAFNKKAYTYSSAMKHLLNNLPNDLTDHLDDFGDYFQQFKTNKA